MADLQKVISGLEHHSRGQCSFGKDDICPYWSEENDSASLCRDALALLKAQQPRVLAVGEVEAYLSSPDGDKKPLWLEWSTIPSLNGWVLPSQVADLMKRHLGFYNVNWRPWTSRPTDEERKAVAWDD